MLYVICYMLYVICYMLYVICYMLYVICYMLFCILNYNAGRYILNCQIRLYFIIKAQYYKDKLALIYALKRGEI